MTNPFLILISLTKFCLSGTFCDCAAWNFRSFGTTVKVVWKIQSYSWYQEVRWFVWNSNNFAIFSLNLTSYTLSFTYLNTKFNPGTLLSVETSRSNPSLCSWRTSFTRTGTMLTWMSSSSTEPSQISSLRASSRGNTQGLSISKALSWTPWT